MLRWNKQKFMPIILIFLLSPGCSETQLDKAIYDDAWTKTKLILTFRPGFVHATDEDGRTRLHIAALRNQLDVAGLLIAKGADVTAGDRYGFTPLHYASLRGSSGIAGLLINKNADIEAKNHYDYTPLHCASTRGHQAVVETLIVHGANVFATDKDGQSPAQLAADANHFNIYDLLTPLHAAAKNGDLEQIRSLLGEHPDSINSKNYAGRTPLHTAMRYDQPEAAALLLANGADKSAKDKFGYIPDYYPAEKRLERIGIDSIEPAAEEVTDRLAFEMLSKYTYINIGLVYNGEIVFTKSYGEGRLNSNDVWGSVSKPVTAMLTMHLVSRGIIDSIDDPIWKYSPRYDNCMPAEYTNDSLTIRHLLIHKSGIPHNDEPTWKDNKLNLKFKPGTKDQYSTPGYGILGHVIEDVTGKSYSEAVKTYIGAPVSASSFWAEKHFLAPGARIHSTIKDMALFSIGVMNNVYVSPEMFYDEMIQYHNGPTGLGWGIIDLDSRDLILFHGGSNGRPQAMLLIKPRKKSSICILARSKDPHVFELSDFAFRLLSALDDVFPVVSQGNVR